MVASGDRHNVFSLEAWLTPQWAQGQASRFMPVTINVSHNRFMVLHILIPILRNTFFLHTLVPVYPGFKTRQNYLEMQCCVHDSDNGKFAEKGLVFRQRNWKHMPNGHSQISRSGWRLGQWDLYRLCGTKLDITRALLEVPISSLLSFKIF
jgi:hypothetical protein